MHKGTHFSKKLARKTPIGRTVIVIVAMILVVVLAAGGTVAYLTTQTDAVINFFNPSEVQCAVTESDGTYTVKNTGDVEAYIRVAIAGNWVGSSSLTGTTTMHWMQPDFTVTPSAGWAKGDDGFYYYTSPLPADTNNVTSALTVALAEGQSAPSTAYTFTVHVVAEAIQSVPTTSVTDAWGVTVADDGRTISK